jgi:DnaJ-class molecular chaperone|tara:strand:- start:1546 stop:1707 length:162 start_codon:yes stop_codon:yes gene_type:complete
MSKLIECPNCLGTGDEFVKGKYPRKCRTCTGEGVVSSDIASNFIDEHLYDSLL